MDIHAPCAQPQGEFPNEAGLADARPPLQHEDAPSPLLGLLRGRIQPHHLRVAPDEACPVLKRRQFRKRPFGQTTPIEHRLPIEASEAARAHGGEPQLRRQIRETLVRRERALVGSQRDALHQLHARAPHLDRTVGSAFHEHAAGAQSHPSRRRGRHRARERCRRAQGHPAITGMQARRPEGKGRARCVRGGKPPPEIAAFLLQRLDQAIQTGITLAFIRMDGCRRIEFDPQQRQMHPLQRRRLGIGGQRAGGGGKFRPGGNLACAAQPLLSQPLQSFAPGGQPCMPIVTLFRPPASEVAPGRLGELACERAEVGGFATGQGAQEHFVRQQTGVAAEGNPVPPDLQRAIEAGA